MVWFTYYITSVVVVPFLFGIVWFDNSEEKQQTISHGSDVFEITMFCLLWPICIGLIIYSAIVTIYKTRIDRRFKYIKNHYRILDINHNDRSALMEVPENELKFLLKYYRKERITLPVKTAEMIREELMNRNAERQLLG